MWSFVLLSISLLFAIIILYFSRLQVLQNSFNTLLLLILCSIFQPKIHPILFSSSFQICFDISVPVLLMFFKSLMWLYLLLNDRPVEPIYFFSSFFKLTVVSYITFSIMRLLPNGHVVLVLQLHGAVFFHQTIVIVV